MKNPATLMALLVAATHVRSSLAHGHQADADEFKRYDDQPRTRHTQPPARGGAYYPSSTGITRIVR